MTRSRKSSVAKTESDELIDNTWISATMTFNYMMKDPLLDWLKYHQNSSNRSITSKRSQSQNTDNFTSYIMESGKTFERKVMKLITKKFGTNRVIEINGESSPRNPMKVEETLNAMKKGIPIIHSGVLHNSSNKTFGIPDLLVRSDWLKFLVKSLPISEKDEVIPAPKLGSGEWHYRVIDIKYTSLLLRSDGVHLLNSKTFPAYKAQLLIYNWALGKLQGYTPNDVYILGRKWNYTSRGEFFEGFSCFDRLGSINYNGLDSNYVKLTNEAINWIQEVRSEEASEWNITKYPLDRWELYPNMCNSYDFPWHEIKENLAAKSHELTKLWMVGPKNRNIAIGNGIYSWSDKDCNAKSLGIKGKKTSKILDAVININRSKKKKISPDYISNNIGIWKWPDTLEFFVDFEDTNGVIFEIKNLPEANVSKFIDHIGVGYVDPKTQEWTSVNFTTKSLCYDEEERICTEFSAFIRSKAAEYGVKKPKCFHWGGAEHIMWTGAVDRHDSVSETWKSWCWDWVDLLTIFKFEPIVINGCMSFGLKDVATAMKNHGFIQTGWDKNSSCTDGEGAMIAGYKANKMAKSLGVSMSETPIMKQLIEYNKTDVRVLYEILTYLRIHHSSKRKRHDIKLVNTKRRKINKDISILDDMNLDD